MTALRASPSPVASTTSIGGRGAERVGRGQDSNGETAGGARALGGRAHDAGDASAGEHGPAGLRDELANELRVVHLLLAGAFAGAEHTDQHASHTGC